MTTTTAPSSSSPRDLNDYESMLATLTCNIGMALTVVPGGSHEEVEQNLREAWRRCVAERRQLQVKLVPKEGDVGPLGQQRYGLAAIGYNDDVERQLVVVEKETNGVSNSRDALDDDDDDVLLANLRQIGNRGLDISKGSYFVKCILQEEAASSHHQDNPTTIVQVVQVIISLSHALSDGPGALRVARSFLMHLGNVFNSLEYDMEKIVVQPLTDLQALILGNDYAQQEQQKDVFHGQATFTASLGGKQPTPVLDDGTPVLPVEDMQNMPKDPGYGSEPGFVDCIHFSLTAEETSLLRKNCREHSTTVQGALVAAALKARLAVLDQYKKHQQDGPGAVFAAVQIPVNTRSIVAQVDDDLCLCGSAGVWHTATIPLQAAGSGANNDYWWDLAKESTEQVRAGIADDQPREWLRRLFHAPATLPPYSMMLSSVGVAPVEASYGGDSSTTTTTTNKNVVVRVDKLHFFGASLRTERPSQFVASMIHAVTFRDEFHCLVNFTSPGIAKGFVERNAKEIKDTLLSLARA